MQISVKIDGLDEVKKSLAAMQKELPYAIARSLSKTAVAVKQAEYDHMSKVFDRPTPYTMRSLYTQPATQDKLESRVWLKEKLEAGKGTAATQYLGPQIFGGGRNLKRHEIALQRIGILPKGMYCVPGKGAELDAYGNMKSSQIVKILSYFQAFSEVGYRANMTAAKKAKMAKGKSGKDYFVVYPGRLFPPGIYQSTLSGGTLTKAVRVIAFVRPPVYRKRFLFWETAEKVAQEKWRPLFDEAMEAALDKAR
jgi:hypothetical protein